MSDREIAWRILQRVENQGGYASLLLDQQDDFVRHLVLGVLRWRGWLDPVIAWLANRTIAQMDQPALQLLRIGVYQLAYMNVPAHAAVAETMRVASSVAPRAKPFVNAVLRRASRIDLREYDPPQETEAKALAFRYSHPVWMVERWIAQWGSVRAERILAANQEHSYPDLLVNTTCISAGEAQAILGDREAVFERSSVADNVFRLRQSSRVVAEEIRAGLFYPMDEASVAVASLMARRGARVLDLCAAPGGKSLVLGCAGADVFGHDSSYRRLDPLVVSHRRFFGRPARAVVGDARLPAFRPGAFDFVLVDAPCSATGTLRKNPEIKWRLKPDDLAAFAVTQREILRGACSLQPQEILYATCSLEPEENDAVIDIALSSGFSRRDLREIAGEKLHPWISEGVMRLTPESGTDGFTALWLSRK